MNKYKYDIVVAEKEFYFNMSLLVRYLLTLSIMMDLTYDLKIFCISNFSNLNPRGGNQISYFFSNKKHTHYNMGRGAEM